MTTEIEVLAEDVGFAEGPVAFADGSVAFTSITHACVYRVPPGGGTVAKVPTGGGPNGLTAAADGALLVAQNGGLFGGEAGTDPGIQRIVGNTVEHLLVLPDGAPNDLCFGPDGRLYFTDTHGTWDGAGPAPLGKLYACDRDGSNLVELEDGLSFANGIAFDPSGTRLVVVETGTRSISSRAWHADATLGPSVELCRLTSGGPDGVAFDRDGRLWVAATTADAVEVFSRSGELVARHECGLGSMPTNCCFGVADPSNLYVTAGGAGQLLRLATTSIGAPLRVG